MKLCITLIIMAATECVSGVENLFRTANGMNAKVYPDYGQYIPE